MVRMRSRVQASIVAPSSDLFLNFRINGSFLLQSEALNKGENGLARRGREPVFASAFIFLVVWEGDGLILFKE